MSINGAPVMAATVVAVDVGKNTAALSVTDADRRRLLGPVDFGKIVTGKTTANDVRTLLGAPVRAYPPRAGQGETWQYTYRGNFERRMFWVELSPDGTVRGTSDTPDLDAGAFRRP